MAPKRGNRGKEKLSESSTPRRGRRPREDEDEEALEFNPLYFLSIEKQNTYQSNYFHRQILTGRTIDFSFFRRHGVDLTQFFSFLGIISILSEPLPVYPTLIKHFFSNLHFTGANELSTYVKGVHITLTEEIFCKLLQLSTDNLVDLSTIEFSLILRTVFNRENIQPLEHPSANSLPPLHRLLHLIICHCIDPRGGHYDFVSPLNSSIIYALVTQTPFDIGKYMFDLLRNIPTSNRNLPFGMLFTRLFHHFNIDLNGEEFYHPSSSDRFDENSLKRMGIKIVNGHLTRQRQPAAPIEGEHQADEPHPQAPPVWANRLIDSISVLHNKMDGLKIDVQGLSNRVDLIVDRMDLLEDHHHQMRGILDDHFPPASP